MEKINEIEKFIQENWFYDSEEPDFKIINVDKLLDFIEKIKRSW